MSEMSGSSTSVLLPTAKVGLFLLDESIREAAKALTQDWRFVRVTFEIHSGDVEAAIAAYKDSESPDLVIVETATIEEGFASRLEVLAGNCSATTAAVVVGPVNDVYLYRKLIDMGVSDYLVRPLAMDVLADVIARTLIDRLGNPGSRLIACIGSKGGVGTSTLAQALAYSATDRFEQKATLLDAAGGWSYLAVALGREPITTLGEVARACGSADQDAFRRMVVDVTDKLSVLSCGVEGLWEDNITADQYELILNRLMSTSPLVVVDLSGAPQAICKAVLMRAHNVAVVTTPTLPALRTARTLINEIKTLRGNDEKDIEMILNMEGIAPGIEVSMSDIETAMGHKPFLTLKFNPKIFMAAEMQGKKLDEVNGGAEVIAGVDKLASRMLGIENLKDRPDKKSGQGTGFLGDFLGKLKTK